MYCFPSLLTSPLSFSLVMFFFHSVVMTLFPANDVGFFDISCIWILNRVVVGCVIDVLKEYSASIVRLKMGRPQRKRQYCLDKRSFGPVGRGNSYSDRGY
jgi:hypothetical protein